MQFEYLYKIEAMGTIEIEDIANCCVIATNDLYQEYILIIQTILGDTRVIKYGPKNTEFNEPCPFINYTYNNFQYSQHKIIKIIDDFINDGKKGISQVQIVDIEEAKNHIKNLVDYL